MKILELNDLSIWYKENHMIINHLNLDVNGGQIIGLLGRNGQGKSTLLNTICALHKYYKGSIKINGSNDIFSIEVKKMRYYIQDNPAMFEEISPKKYFLLLHNLYGKVFDPKKLEYYNQIFQFEEYCDQRISTLSLGNRKKTNIIGALMLEAPLLILDEPLNGLDIMSVDALYKELKEYAKNGNAVIFSTHIIDVLPQVCTDVAILENQKIEKYISVNESTDLRKVFQEVIQAKGQ